MTTTEQGRESRRSTAASRRRAREQEIVAATRALFDQRGVRDAQIDDIARAVGINRAIVYRHFTGKEEIFALTLVEYLDELRGVLAAADVPGSPAADRLRRLVEAFAAYGVQHPAFVDCAQSLMRRTGDELLDEISESAMFRLGRGMTGCLGVLTAVLEEGAATGEFHLDDPALVSNMLYASGLGALQLARVGLLVTESAPGVPGISHITADQVRDYLVTSALSLVTTPH